MLEIVTIHFFWLNSSSLQHNVIIVCPSVTAPECRDVFEDAMVEAKAKARSLRIKTTYAYEILKD